MPARVPLGEFFLAAVTVKPTVRTHEMRNSNYSLKVLGFVVSGHVSQNLKIFSRFVYSNIANGLARENRERCG